MSNVVTGPGWRPEHGARDEALHVDPEGAPRLPRPRAARAAGQGCAEPQLAKSRAIAKFGFLNYSPVWASLRGSATESPQQAGKIGHDDENYLNDYLGLLGTMQNQAFFSVKQVESPAAGCRHRAICSLPKFERRFSECTMWSVPRYRILYVFVSFCLKFKFTIQNNFVWTSLSSCHFMSRPFHVGTRSTERGWVPLKILFRGLDISFLQNQSYSNGSRSNLQYDVHCLKGA